MKKLVAIILTLTVIGTILTGCGASQSTKTEGKSEAAKVIEQAEKMTLQEL